MNSKKMRFAVVVVIALMSLYSLMMFAGCGSDSSSGPSTPAPKAGNVFLDSLFSATSFTVGTGANDPALNYKFLHGCTNPAGTKMFVVVNEATSQQGTTTNKAFTWLLDAVDLTQGTVTALASGTLGPTPVGQENTTFRCTWTDDGTKIALAGGGTFWLIDANSSTLAPLNGANGTNVMVSAGDHNHDAIPTADGKYVILTMRAKPYSGGTTTADDAYLDGQLQVFDATTMALVGSRASVCNDCHGQASPKNATLCGIDGKVTKQSDGTYSGTVYVAGHGGHVAKATVTFAADGTGIATTLGTHIQIQPAGKKFPDGTSEYKLHDVRLDKTTLYWSTYNLDANSKMHHGTYNLSTNAVTADNAVDVDARAIKPTVAANAMPMYCASGQTSKAYMPMTMTSEAFITVVPK